MTEKTIDLSQKSNNVTLKLKDNGDGTHTPYVEAELNVGDVNIGNIDIASLPPLVAGTAVIGEIKTSTFDVTDQFTRPANATPYSANQAINCKLTVTEVSYSGLVVTLKAAAHGLLAGARITVAGVNTGATVTHIDGNWVVTWADTDHIRFTVLIQPTGTTPQTGLTITSAIAKMLSFDIGGVPGGGVWIYPKVSLPGKAMTGAIRLYLDTSQVTVLVDATSYSLLFANAANRKKYVDMTPATEDTNSDCTIAQSDTPIFIKCASGDTRVYARLVAEAAGTPANAGVVSLTLSGFQALG